MCGTGFAVEGIVVTAGAVSWASGSGAAGAGAPASGGASAPETGGWFFFFQKLSRPMVLGWLK
ncbi:hypothetical protein DFAR_570037 [Desulfarculales bacterium]